ncbi:MAG: SDR family NAD(P)-dependent oxidoreductase [Christensenellaceae bacterium]|jgi:NAD(P)-dependent dehydrogenase (short-subunit alcohol dehydrogenase family)
MRLKDKVAVITGSAMGMGKATAMRFAREGAKIVVADRDLAGAQKTAAEIQKSGGQAEAVEIDVSKESSVAAGFKKAVELFSKIDILVNCAGINGVNKWTHEVEEGEWDAVFAVDVKGVFFCTKHAVPYMKANKSGAIVNFSSIYGLVGADESAPYVAAKGAVTNMTREDAVCYGTSGIRVNSVCPGTILTELTLAKAREVEGGEQAYIDQMVAKHPIGHVGEPDDVANAVLFLASDEARFITGVNLPVDGGYTAR